ncbi:collagen alpha-1(I) chain-like [Hippopotamus amphibius kiboko]|uniref:collagen alpha-1(I) chain-like n=1 Tax=Hippopotamus amphibius kiboko TaxID=575201 RepID=UPI002594F475|nr:collagen alpha-1(I) chain-like [Hippopotamus amphibius kiboko]
MTTAQNGLGRGAAVPGAASEPQGPGTVTRPACRPGGGAREARLSPARLLRLFSAGAPRPRADPERPRPAGLAGSSSTWNALASFRKAGSFKKLKSSALQGIQSREGWDAAKQAPPGRGPREHVPNGAPAGSASDGSDPDEPDEAGFARGALGSRSLRRAYGPGRLRLLDPEPPGAEPHGRGPPDGAGAAPARPGRRRSPLRAPDLARALRLAGGAAGRPEDPGHPGGAPPAPRPHSRLHDDYSRRAAAAAAGPPARELSDRGSGAAGPGDRPPVEPEPPLGPPRPTAPKPPSPRSPEPASAACRSSASALSLSSADSEEGAEGPAQGEKGPRCLQDAGHATCDPGAEDSRASSHLQPGLGGADGPEEKTEEVVTEGSWRPASPPPLEEERPEAQRVPRRRWGSGRRARPRPLSDYGQLVSRSLSIPEDSIAADPQKECAGDGDHPPSVAPTDPADQAPAGGCPRALRRRPISVIGGVGFYGSSQAEEGEALLPQVAEWDAPRGRHWGFQLEERGP